MTIEAQLDEIIALLKAKAAPAVIPAEYVVAAQAPAGLVAQPAPEPVKAAPKPRGRPPKAEAPAPAPAVAAPQHSLDDVRNAAKAYSALHSQAEAVAKMKEVSGAESLGMLQPQFYDAVVAAFTIAAPAKPAAEIDPFDTPAPAAAPAAASLSLEDLKAAIVKAQKRTSTETVQKVVMAHGGVAASAPGTPAGVSLKALPAAKYAETIAAIGALPSTK